MSKPDWEKSDWENFLSRYVFFPERRPAAALESFEDFFEDEARREAREDEESEARIKEMFRQSDIENRMWNERPRNTGVDKDYVWGVAVFFFLLYMIFG